MNLYKRLLFSLTIFTCSTCIAQNDTSRTTKKNYPVRQVTIEPGLGIHTNAGTDLLITNLVQWNPYKHLSLASHTSYNINNALQRNFNGIQTNYNYSINQKIGAGTTFYTQRSAHTFLLMAGLKYTSFKESLVTPDLDKVSSLVNSVSPDYGFMYSLKKGVNKYFFSFRMYVPLYPWPIKDSNILAVDGNMNNVSLEFGVGIKIN
ncbi:MAG: hypothetical protein JWQ30_1256 [Sediminibacterium sp.]|nr:hypothetical protein [Sediminibacterium sp.]